MLPALSKATHRDPNLSDAHRGGAEEVGCIMDREMRVWLPPYPTRVQAQD